MKAPCSVCRDEMFVPKAWTPGTPLVCGECAPGQPGPIVEHGANADGTVLHADCRLCAACRGFARAS